MNVNNRQNWQKNILKEYMQCSFSFEKWSKAKRLIFSHVIMKFKALCSNAACNVRYRSDQIKHSPVTDGVSGSSSSEDERERSESPPCPKNTKKVNRLFVWLSKPLKPPLVGPIGISQTETQARRT